MPAFTRPEFPDRTVTVRMRRRGMSTQRIQAAIDAVRAAGGGTVVVPAGVWQTERNLPKKACAATRGPDRRPARSPRYIPPLRRG